MKMYRLRVPPGSNALLDEYITVPNTLSGIQMGEWWKTASYESRVNVVNSGLSNGDYVAAWEKIAAEEECKEKCDLKEVIRKLEAEKPPEKAEEK